MIRSIGSDIKAGATVLGNATKTGVTKGINLTNSYLNKTTKAMASQPKKLVVANAGAAGSLEFSSEASEYVTGRKEFTVNNVTKSGVKIGGSALNAGITAEIPLVSAIGVNMIMNKIIEGDAKPTETIRNNILGTSFDNVFPDKSGIKNPFLKEAINKIGDKFGDSNYDEK